MFSEFKIPDKDPTTTCNKRIYLPGGEEGYCQELVDDKRRCFKHNPGKIKLSIREEADLIRLKESSTLEERSKELAKAKRNLTTLDEQVLNSLATIQELERRYPIATISPSDAIQLQKLRLEHADLIDRRVELEIKLRMVLNAEWLYDEASKLFEEKIVDGNTRQIVKEQFGEMLDRLVEAGGGVELPPKRQ